MTTERPTAHQMEVFEAVCRLGSQQQAAHALGMTQRAVAVTLSRLYERIGADGIGHAAYLIWGPGRRPDGEHVYEMTRRTVLTEAHP